MKTNNQWREFFRCQQAGIVATHWAVVFESQQDVGMDVLRVNGTAVAWRYHGLRWTCIPGVEAGYVEQLVSRVSVVV